MNNDLNQLLISYATQEHSEVISLLHGKSKDNNISILIDLLTHYFNDKNSSTLREIVLVSLTGFQHNSKKIGYNGYKQEALSGQTKYCEAKPKNVNTNEFKSDGKPKQLNGGGNFTDYTFGRFNKNKQDNPLMLVGGFLDGRLVYSFEFPFNSNTFVKRLNEQLKRRFSKGDIKGQYLRSASFGFNHFEKARDLKINIFIDLKQLEKYQPFITNKLYDLFKSELIKRNKIDEK